MDEGTVPKEGILEGNMFWWEDHYAILHVSLQFYSPFTWIWAPGGWLKLPQQAPMFFCFWLSFASGQEVTGQRRVDVKVFIPLAHCLLSVSFYFLGHFTQWKVIFLWFFLGGVVKFFLIYSHWKVPLLSGQEADWNAMNLLLLVLGVRNFRGFCEARSSR